MSITFSIFVAAGAVCFAVRFGIQPHLERIALALEQKNGGKP